jgi:hypothetical protein
MLCSATRVQGTRALDLKEHVKRCAGKTLAPTRRVNPIGNLARILDREARDLSDQDAVALDRAQRVLRIRSNTAVVGVERPTVRWVRTCEGRHPHRRRVPFKREQLVEIAILYRSKTQAAHARTLMLNTLLVPDPVRSEHRSHQWADCRNVAAVGVAPPLPLWITPGPKEKPIAGLESRRDDPVFRASGSEQYSAARLFGYRVSVATE